MEKHILKIKRILSRHINGGRTNVFHVKLEESKSSPFMCLKNEMVLLKNGDFVSVKKLKVGDEIVAYIPLSKPIKTLGEL